MARPLAPRRTGAAQGLTIRTVRGHHVACQASATVRCSQTTYSIQQLPRSGLVQQGDRAGRLELRRSSRALVRRRLIAKTLGALSTADNHGCF